MVNTRGVSGSGTATMTLSGGKKGLQFSEKLVGKGLSTDAMLKKLKSLHTELARLDQDEVDVGSLAGVRKELISHSVVLHKDKGVKAYAACCLADILKLYAPDAPYTQDELKDIFQFFFRQLTTGLKGTNAPYYEQYFYLLDSLAKCKSVVLVCDLPNADELMEEVFRDFFVTVKHNLVKNIEMAMADILCALIDECQSMPTDVLDTIMAQFKEKNAGMEHPGYRLALEVCNSRADRLQRHVCQYLTDIIIQSSTEEDLDDLKAAHDLIKQLNRAAPGLLHNIVPQLEEQLRVETQSLRLMATQTLGHMFSDKNGADLAQKHSSTWTTWVHRRNDKAIPVRIAMFEALPDVLVAHPELRKELAETLAMKLEDPEDRVRVAVCKAYAKLDYEHVLHDVQVEHLKQLAERVKDKKVNVRAEALSTLGKLYKLAFPEIENNSAAAINHFSWIPEQILHVITTSADVKEGIETAMADLILPIPAKGEDEVAWTERLLLVMRFMDDDAVKALLSLSNLKLSRPTPLERFIDCCVAYNGGTIDENEDTVKKQLAGCIQRLAALLYTDKAKATEDLNAFAKANEQRLYQLARKLADPSIDLKTLAKTLAEFTRRVEQSVSSSATETLTRLARSTCLWIINSSSIPTLLSKFKSSPSNKKATPRMSYSEAAQQDAMDNSKKLFQAICKFSPGALKVNLAEFGVALMDKDEALVEMGLQGMAALAVHDSTLAPADRRIVDRVVKAALSDNPRHTKFAARILAKVNSDKSTQVVKTIATTLPKATSLHASIVALTQFARYAPETFEDFGDTIINYVVPDVLTLSIEAEDAMDVDVEDEWVDDDRLPELAKAKLAAIKMLRYRSLSQASSEHIALEVTQPVLRMLFTALDFNGALQEESTDPGTVRTRVRFQAAVSLLHLATVHVYALEIVKKFSVLALMIQDPCYNVRMNFLHKYTALAMRLETRFFCIPFLTAQDPERETRDYARNFFTIQYQRMPPDARQSKLELVFLRYLHLLAHHPDFANEVEVLKDMCRYIEFYVDTICNADNVAFIYCLAQRCKSVRDADPEDDTSENLYIVSELAQEIIKGRAKHHSWVLNNFPGKFKLPTDIFKPLPSPEEAKKIARTVYLDDALSTWLDDHNRPIKSPVQRAPRKRKAAKYVNGSSPVKRSRTGNGAAARRKQHKWSGGEDSDSTIDDSDDSLVIEPPVVTRGSKSRPTKKVKEPEQVKEEESMEEEIEDDDIVITKSKLVKPRPARGRSSRKSKGDDDDAMDEDVSEQEGLTPKGGTRGKRTPQKLAASTSKGKAKTNAKTEESEGADEPVAPVEEHVGEQEQPASLTRKTTRQSKPEPKPNTTPAKRGKK